MDLFGVELLTPGGVADEIGEQHRHLPPLADWVDRWCREYPRLSCVIGRGRGEDAQGSNRVEQFAAVAHRDDAEFLEIPRSEPEQNVGPYRVITKRLLVLTQTKVAQPSREVHARLLVVWRSVMRLTPVEFRLRAN